MQAKFFESKHDIWGNGINSLGSTKKSLNYGTAWTSGIQIPKELSSSKHEDWGSINLKGKYDGIYHVLVDNNGIDIENSKYL